MSDSSLLSEQPELVQLAVQGVLVLLGLYLLIAFLRLFTQSGLESRVRSYGGGRRGDEGKRGEARTSHLEAGADTEQRTVTTRRSADDA